MSFLADLNNEGRFNAGYREQMQRLDKFVMIALEADDAVIPWESCMFSCTAWEHPVSTGGPGQQAGELLPLQETQIWREDLIGLQWLHRHGRLETVVVPGLLHGEWFLPFWQKYVFPHIAVHR